MNQRQKQTHLRGFLSLGFGAAQARSQRPGLSSDIEVAAGLDRSAMYTCIYSYTRNAHVRIYIYTYTRMLYIYI